MQKSERIDSKERLLEVMQDVQGYMSLEYAEKQINRMFSIAGFGDLDEDNFWKYRECLRYIDELDVHYIDPSFPELMDYLIDEDMFSNPVLSGCFSDRYYHGPLFPHLSVDNDGMIAFTPNEEYGKQDRQLKMKFGKFWRKYYHDDVTDNELKNLTNAFLGKFGSMEVNFAEGADIAKVYSFYHKGFSSCMCDDEDHHFDSHTHPTEVYNTPDIQLAWVGEDGGYREGVVTARALINVPKKEYSRVYGNEQLAFALESMGYTQGDLEGCRLLKIQEDDDCYVMPYLDETDTFTEYDGDHWVVSVRGEHTADSTIGYIHTVQQEMCDHCEDYVNADSLTPTEGYGHVCSHCLEDNFVEAYNAHGEVTWAYHETVVEVESDDYITLYHTDCIDSDIVYSGYHDCYFKEEDAIWSDTVESYIARDTAIEVEIISETERDYVPEEFDIDPETMRLAS
jgi:hypothetical protein